jgi:DNA invertase Pin-like site-specific DNA recombinase
VIWKLDRLGRDLKHLVTIIDNLTARGIGLKVLTGQGASLDTTTSSGRLVFGIFAALAEYERSLIIERTKAGLAAARARGRVGGRRRRMTATKLRLIQQAVRSRTVPIGTIAQEHRIHRATVYAYVHPDGTLTALGAQVLHGTTRRDDLAEAAD